MTNPMFRIIIYAIAGVLVLGLSYWLLKDPCWSIYLSHKAKISLSVSSVKRTDVGLQIKGLKIKNPKGFKKGVALFAKEAEVIYAPSVKKKSDFSKLEMHDLSIRIDCKNSICTQNNWASFLDMIDKKERGAASPSQIGEVVLRNVEISLLQTVGQEEKFHFDKMDFLSLKSQKGFPSQQIIVAIFREANLKEYLPEREGFFKDLFIRLKNLFEESPQL